VKALPPLPTELFSVLGPLPIETLDAQRAKEGEMLGVFNAEHRTIGVADIAHEMRWATLWHEATHVALYDSGVNNALTEEQAEMVCDAMGAYLTAMMRAGYLAVSRPR